MNKHAGGRPAKSGARRELKTFRLVPDAIERLERLAGERGGSTSDVLNELLLTSDAPRLPRLEVLPAPTHDEALAPNVTRFRVLTGKARPDAAEDAGRVAHELERLRDALGGVLGEIESLMAEQLAEPALEAANKKARTPDAYGQGFRDGMLEALETAYALLQAELLISDGV